MARFAAFAPLSLTIGVVGDAANCGFLTLGRGDLHRMTRRCWSSHRMKAVNMSASPDVPECDS
jgi:hypothetical protein